MVYRLCEDILIETENGPELFHAGLLVEGLIDHLTKTFPNVPDEFLQKTLQFPKYAMKLAYAYTQELIDDVNDETVEAVKDLEVPKIRDGQVQKTKYDYKKEEFAEKIGVKPTSKKFNAMFDAMVAADPSGEKLAFIDHIMRWTVEARIDIVEDYDSINQLLAKYQELKNSGYNLEDLDTYEDPGDLADLVSTSEQESFAEYGEVLDKKGPITLYFINEWHDGTEDGRTCHAAFANSGWCVRNTGYFDSYNKGGSAPGFYLFTEKSGSGESPLILIKKGKEIKERFNKTVTDDNARKVFPLIRSVISDSEMKDAVLMSIVSPKHSYSYESQVIQAFGPAYDTDVDSTDIVQGDYDIINSIGDSAVYESNSAKPNKVFVFIKGDKIVGSFIERRQNTYIDGDVKILNNGESVICALLPSVFSEESMKSLFLMKSTGGHDYTMLEWDHCYEGMKGYKDNLVNISVSDTSKGIIDPAILLFRKNMLSDDQANILSNNILKYSNSETVINSLKYGINFNQQSLKEYVLSHKDPDLSGLYMVRYEDDIPELATQVITGASKEITKAYISMYGASDFSTAVRTAIDSKNRLSKENELQLIEKDIGSAISYATVVKGPWPELEKAILNSDDPGYVMSYIENITLSEWPEAEHIIENTPAWHSYQKDYAYDLDGLFI